MILFKFVPFCKNHIEWPKHARKKNASFATICFEANLWLDDGNVRFGFAHPKQILDIYRILCSGKAEVYSQLCNLFDQQTNHGSDMKVYDTLLQKAVDSLFATFRKRAASGL
ncbi:MAG: hypothetical protein LR011_09605, partial [Verrucomicrobia bacterium]|nr:hypothetical protein [Verrucomicrobiota bacterium]